MDRDPRLIVDYCLFLVSDSQKKSIAYSQYYETSKYFLKQSNELYLPSVSARIQVRNRWYIQIR